MTDKPLVIIGGEIKSPPLSEKSRRWAGFILRSLQRGERLSMPDSRPMPRIGPRCHELRIVDKEFGLEWRLIYRIDRDYILVVDIFVKKRQETPSEAIERCIARLKRYDRLVKP